MKKSLLKLCVIAVILCVSSCLNVGCYSEGTLTKYSVKVNPFLEAGQDYINFTVINGNFLKFNLINSNSEDYLVQFDLKTKGKSEQVNGQLIDYEFLIPNILVSAHANTNSLYFVNKYHREGYFEKNKFQFFSDRMAETVEVINLRVIKACERLDLALPYTDTQGRRVYDTCGASLYNEIGLQ